MKKIRTQVAASIIILSISCYADNYIPQGRERDTFWFTLAAEGVNNGIEAFTTKQNEMYEIRGYMQQNPELAATIDSAYKNWHLVRINSDNSQLYEDFFSIILPRMQIVMSSHSNNSGILIDEKAFRIAMQIIDSHDDIQDPGFLQLKRKITEDLNVLRGQKYNNVRSWFKGELY